MNRRARTRHDNQTTGAVGFLLSNRGDGVGGGSVGREDVRFEGGADHMIMFRPQLM